MRWLLAGLALLLAAVTPAAQRGVAANQGTGPVDEHDRRAASKLVRPSASTMRTTWTRLRAAGMEDRGRTPENADPSDRRRGRTADSDSRIVCGRSRRLARRPPARISTTSTPGAALRCACFRRQVDLRRESQALHDAVAPVHPESYFAAALDDLARLLPGDGPLVRFDAYRQQFVIPRDRLACLRSGHRRMPQADARARQAARQRNIHRRCVTNKSWSSYN